MLYTLWSSWVLNTRVVSDLSRVLFCHFREQRQLLEKCAATALNSKLIAGQKDLFSKMVVDAVMSLDELLSLKMIGIKKVQGGALEVCVTDLSLNCVCVCLPFEKYEFSWKLNLMCQFHRILSWSLGLLSKRPSPTLVLRCSLNATRIQRLRCSTWSWNWRLRRTTLRSAWSLWRYDTLGTSSY